MGHRLLMLPLWLLAGSCLIPPLDPEGKLCLDAHPCPAPWTCTPSGAAGERVCRLPAAGCDDQSQTGPEKCDGADGDCDGRVDVERARELADPEAYEVAALAGGGGYAVAWLSRGAGGIKVSFVRLGAELTPQGAALELFAGRDATDLSLSPFGAHVLVAWLDHPAPGVLRLAAAKVDPAGPALLAFADGGQGPLLLLPVSSLAAGPRAAATLDGEAFVLAWTTVSGRVQAWSRGREGDHLASATLAQGVLPDGTGELGEAVDVVPLGTGFAVGWGARDDAGQVVRVRPVDVALEPQGARPEVVREAQGPVRLLRLAGGADDVAAAWAEGSAEGWRVRASAQALEDEPVLVAQLPSGEQVFRLALLAGEGGAPSPLVSLAHGEGAATAVSTFALGDGGTLGLPVLLEPAGVTSLDLASSADPGKVAILTAGGGARGQGVCLP